MTPVSAGRSVGDADTSDMHPVDYTVYIRSEAWRRRRTNYFHRHLEQCRACRSRDGIHLHHVTYERLGNEPDSDLVPLCEACHSAVHALHRLDGGTLRQATHAVITHTQKVGTPPASRKRPQQSSRHVRFNGRTVPACRAHHDTCPHAAPSGNGYCWQHDPNVETGSTSTTVKQVQAQQRDIAARAALKQRGKKRNKPTRTANLNSPESGSDSRDGRNTR